MAGSDELIFTGDYKEFRQELRFDLSSADEAEFAKVLGYVSDRAEMNAFSLSDIDVKAIEAYAKPSGEGLQAVLDFLKANPQAKVKSTLKGFCPVPELISAAESCFFNRLMRAAKVSFRMGDSIAVPSTKPGKEPADDQIIFVGKYGKWISIKKLGLEKVQDWEVSAILSGINHTVVNKAFDFGCKERDEALVSKLTSGKRKSYGNLADALEALIPELKRDKLTDAYSICKVFEGIGYKPYASPEMLTQAHPEVKPPKVRGRKPKG